jgi:hypothetical protein
VVQRETFYVSGTGAWHVQAATDPQ